MNTVSVSKLTTINQFDLPNELISIIKDYTFYDKTSLSYIKKMSSFKRPINDTIKSAYSRNNNFGQSLEDSVEDPEYWCFGFDDTERLQLQNNNCSRCGNYQLIGNIQLLRYCRKNVPRIMCCCSNNIYYGWAPDEENEIYNDSEYTDFDISENNDD